MPTVMDVAFFGTVAINLLNGAFTYLAPKTAIDGYFTKLPMNIAPMIVIMKGIGIASLMVGSQLASACAGGNKPTKSNMKAGAAAWGTMLLFMAYINLVDTSMADATAMDKGPQKIWMAIMAVLTGAFAYSADTADVCTKQPGAGAFGTTLFKIGAGLGLMNWAMMFLFTDMAIGVYFNAMPAASEAPYVRTMFKFMGMSQLHAAFTSYSFVHAGAIPSKPNLLAFAFGWLAFALDIVNMVFVDTTLVTTANIDMAGPTAWVFINCGLGALAIKQALAGAAKAGTTPKKTKAK